MASPQTSGRPSKRVEALSRGLMAITGLMRAVARAAERNAWPLLTERTYISTALVRMSPAK